MILPDHYRHAQDFQSELFFLGAFASETVNPHPELCPSDFSNTAYSRLYKAFCAGDFAPDDTNVARYGVDRDTWCSVLESVSSAAQGEYHGRKVRHLALRRAAIGRALHDLATLADPAADRDAVDAIIGTESVDASALVKTADQMWAEAKGQYEGMSRGFSCDIAHLRRVLSLSAPGDHIVVACASGVGKTSLGMQICDRYSTLFVSGEMPAVNIVRRAHAMEYWKTADKGDVEGFLAEEKAQNGEFHALMRGESHHGFFRDHWKYVTDPLDIRGLDAAIRASGSVDMVLVDYLQLMRGEKDQDRRNQMAALARGMKQLAKKHGVRVVSLCQISRPQTGNPFTDPATIPVTLGRLKESGDIEESADYVLGMWLHISRDTGIQAIQDIKNRNAGVHAAAHLKRAGPWFRDADPAEVEAAEYTGPPREDSKNRKREPNWTPD